jgi:hypothetical protein
MIKSYLILLKKEKKRKEKKRKKERKKELSYFIIQINDFNN